MPANPSKIEILEDRRLIIVWLEKTNLQLLQDNGQFKKGGVISLAQHLGLTIHTARNRYTKYIENYHEAKAVLPFNLFLAVDKVQE
jgi:hypothetical protein